MSEQGENMSTSGFDTPVPELDDHRHQAGSMSRTDRPRRGTFDSLYAHQHGQENQWADHLQSAVRVRDFEEAIIDEDAGDLSPGAFRKRRPTIETMGQRSLSPSPPNSVKAFADARRRERELSFSEHRPEKKGDDSEPNRAVSVASRRSHRSRPHTVDVDAASLATNKSAAEEDVCYPLPDEHQKRNLHIDFDYLENFMLEDEMTRAATRRPSVAKVFPDLRPQSVVSDSAATQMVTADGDFLEIPSDLTDRQEEKLVEEPEEPPKPAAHWDPNRFGFFSSTLESTVHAAELAGLILPGEDIRGLFTLPKDRNGNTDGVWWLNMHSPTEEEVRAICRAFGVHPLTIEDITTQESREKIELFPSYYFACFRSFTVVEEEDGEVEYEPFHIYVVVFREGTLSFSFAPNAHATNVRKRIAMLKDYVALSSDWICYALM